VMVSTSWRNWNRAGIGSTLHLAGVRPARAKLCESEFFRSEFFRFLLLKELLLLDIHLIK